jgi:two-component system cell cycle sensor histidine kinase/response regulator CckA
MVLEGDSRSSVSAGASGPLGADALAALRDRALDQVGAAIVIVDAGGCITTWSRGATALYGWTADDAVGRRWDDLAGPVADDPDPRRADIRRRLRAGRPYTGELIVKTRAGPRIPIFVDATPVLDDEGTYLGVVTTAIRDDRPDAAAARFEVVFRDSPMASVITVAPRQLILDVNPAFEALSGYSRADAVGRTSNELGLWASDGVGTSLLELTRVGAAIDSVPVRVRHVSGAVLEARVSGRPITLSDGPAYLWMAVDETDRMRAEREARALTQRLDAIVAAAPMAVIALDRDARVLLWNPAAERMTGWSAQEVVGDRRPDGVLETDVVAPILGAARDGTTSPDTTYTLTARDGRQVRAMLAVAAVDGDDADAAGGVGSTVIMAADVTEREAMEAAINDARRMESIGHLASGIAHDFNNLMTSVSGYSNLAITNLGPDHPVAADLREVTRATERAALLTRQLMAFSRQQVIQPERIDLGSTVRDFAPTLERFLGHAITLDISAVSTAYVMADRSVIQQVLVNLAANAGDAMPGGGTLRIATAVVDLDEAAADLGPGMTAGRYVRLTVRDTGMGVDADTAAHMFEPFFTTKPDQQGAGLGLSVVHGLVTQSKGHVAMTSRPGHGATFTITLPEATAAAPAGVARPDTARSDGERHEPAEPPQAAPAEATGPIVLIADDEPSIRVLVARILERAGYRPVVAEDGLAAIALARTMPVIDVLLTDLTMPNIGGVALAAALAMERPGLPVVYMSGYGEDQLAQDGILPADVRLLYKPFDIAALAAIIDEALAARV